MLNINLRKKKRIMTDLMERLTVSAEVPLKGDLDDTILPTICLMRHAYVMPTTRIESCKSTYNILTTDAHNTKNVVGF